MVDFQVVTADNRHLHERLMDDHHVLRKNLYIDRSGWKALTHTDGRESDQFDLDTTIYILGTDGTGALVSGSRLHPSTGPTLLADVFPQLANVRGFERGPDIFEWTRVFTAPAKRTEGRSSTAAGEIYCAVMQYCLDEGIRAVNIVTEAFYVARYVGLGWKLRILGESLEHEGMTLVGVTLPIDEETIASMRRAYGIGPTRFAQGLAERQRAIRAPVGLQA